MELTLEEITYLGRIFQNKNELGLLSNIGAPLKGDEEKSLIRKGIISDGKLTLGMDNFLNIISNPERCCRFIAQVGYLTVEKYSYYKENRTVLAQNNQGNFVFSIDSDLIGIKGQLVDLYGASNLKTTTISFQMKANELLTFAALVDLYRKEELLCYLSGNQPRNSFSLDELQTYMKNPVKNGLMTFLKTNFKHFPSVIDLKVAITELIKKFVLINENGLKFNQETMLFAKNFLLVHSVSLLEILNLKDGQIMISTVIFLNSDVHDVLRIQFLDDEANLSTVTAKQQIDEIMWALNCPELIIQQAEIQRFCPNCGAPIIPESVFCSKCGAKLNGR